MIQLPISDVEPPAKKQRKEAPKKAPLEVANDPSEDFAVASPAAIMDLQPSHADGDMPPQNTQVRPPAEQPTQQDPPSEQDWFEAGLDSLPFIHELELEDELMKPEQVVSEITLIANLFEPPKPGSWMFEPYGLELVRLGGWYS